MSSTNDIIRSIRQIAKNENEESYYALYGAVTSIDTVSFTCSIKPFDGSADLNEIRYAFSEKGGISLVPNVGSLVAVTMTSKTNGYVISVDNSSLIKINGNGFAGLVKVGDLITKLNNLENAYNDLVTKFNTHIHVAVDSITAAPITVSPTVTQETTVITPTIQSDLENTTVVHGSGV